MKKNLVILFVQLFSFSILLSLSSCKKGNLENVKNKQLNATDFKIVGIEHNKALENVYQTLKSSKSGSANFRTTFLTLDYALMLSEQTTIDYVNSSDFSSESTQLAIELINNIYDHMPLMTDNGLYTSVIANSLNAAQIQILDQLNVVMSDDDYSLPSLQNRINNIESQVPSLNLTEEQQIIIYSATSVAKYTLEYWNVNFDEWVALNSNINGRMASRPFNWKQVGKNDIAGAVAGAAATGIARLFGPIGWTIWGGAILGGAVGGSAYDAVMQLLK